MATYKKRGYKARDTKEQQSNLDSQSTTAEVFNTLDESASRSEKWIEKNNKALFYGLLVIVGVMLGTFGYTKYVQEPNELIASNELAFPRMHYDAATTAGSQIDSLLNLGLEGADGNYGFLDIATQYSGTDAGNLANYYAGLSYLQMKDYETAINHLDQLDTDNLLLGAVAIGAIGDAFSDLGQGKQAIKYYEKAANNNDNEFTAPLYLYKAGQLALIEKDFSKAEALFTRIKSEYKNSDQGNGIDKFIAAAKYAGK